MIDQNEFIQAFSHYMRSGDDSALKGFLGELENPAFLRIYRNGFYKACISALKANFISLTSFLEDAEFNQIATQYINRYPPVQATLVAYGMDESLHDRLDDCLLSFPDFLKQILERSQTLLSELLPKLIAEPLIDIALLDQAWFSTLNRVNRNVVGLSQVQTMLAQGQDLSLIPFNLVESVTLVEIQHDLFNHWQKLRFADEVIELPTEKVISHVLFWQYQGEVQAKLLSPIEWHFYNTFLESKVMGNALEAVSQLDADFDISALFADLLNASLLKLED